MFEASVNPIEVECNIGHLQRWPNHFSEGFLVKFKLSRGLAVART
jgi:hypothetical protein